MPPIGYPYGLEYFHGSTPIGYVDYFRMEVYLRRLADDIEARTGPVAAKRVLDVGCAYGFLVDELALRGAKVIGVDISPHAVRQAHALYPSREVLCMDFCDHAPMPGSFDLVTMNVVVTCQENHEAMLTMLQRAKDVMAPGGRLYLTDTFWPGYMNMSLEELGELAGRAFPRGHVITWRDDSFHKLFNLRMVV